MTRHGSCKRMLLMSFQQILGISRNAGPAASPTFSAAGLREVAIAAPRIPIGSATREEAFNPLPFSLRATYGSLAAAGASLDAPSTKLRRSTSTARQQSVPSSSPACVGQQATVQGVVINAPVVKNDWVKLVVQLNEENWAKVQHVYRALPPLKGTTVQHRNARATLKKQINKRQVVVVGTRLTGIEKGDTWVFNGRWDHHDIHGFQLRADEKEEVPVSSQEALLSKLKSLRIGGEQNAVKLLDACGDQLVKILDSPDAVALLVKKKISGIKKATAQKIKQAWDNAKKSQSAESWFAKQGLPGTTYKAALAHFGDPQACMSQDPYLALLQLPGFKLKAAENLATALKVQRRPLSVGAAVVYDALVDKVGSTEHTYYEWSQVQGHIRTTLVKWNEKERGVADKRAAKAGSSSRVLVGEEGGSREPLVLGTSDVDILEYTAVLMGIRKVVLETYNRESGQLEEVRIPPLLLRSLDARIPEQLAPQLKKLQIRAATEERDSSGSTAGSTAGSGGNDQPAGSPNGTGSPPSASGGTSAGPNGAAANSNGAGSNGVAPTSALGGGTGTPVCSSTPPRGTTPPREVTPGRSTSAARSTSPADGVSSSSQGVAAANGSGARAQNEHVAYVTEAAKEIASNWPPKDAFVFLSSLREAERLVSEDVVRLFDTSFSKLHQEHLRKVAEARLAPVAAAFASRAQRGGKRSPTASRGQASQQQPATAAEPARASSTPEPKPILLTEQQQMEVYDVLHNSHKQHSEAQKEAVALAAAAPVMLLTGAAGCGKTFTTKTIVQLWRMRDRRIKLCAPTGRAAKRLQEMVEDQQGLEATTVHRLLGYRRMDDSDDEEEEVQQQGTTQKQGSATPAPASGLDGQGSGADAQSSLTGSTPPPEVQGTAGTAEGTTSGTSTSAGTSTSTTSSSTVTNVDLLDDSLFTFNHRRKLQADAVLVDEASMLDVQLAAALTRALPDGCQLLLVGDPHQLPPVGPGAVLQDLIDSGIVPRVHLDQIYRQGKDSRIVHGAHEIMNGQVPTSIPAHSPAKLDELLTAAAKELGADLSSVLTPSPPSTPGSATAPAAPDDASAAAAGGVATAVTSTTKPRRRISRSMSIDVHKDTPEPGQARVIGGAGQEGLERQQAQVYQVLQKHLDGNGVIVQMSDDVSMQEMAHQVCKIVAQLRALGVDVASQLQVLSPNRSKDKAVATPTLNAMLQPIMNPEPEEERGMSIPPGSLLGVPGEEEEEEAVQQAGRKEASFRVNDRVVQVENNYESEVYNGDLGTVVQVNDAGRIVVEFAPRPGKSENHVVVYNDITKLQLQAAWATTVHKAQGGEVPVVVMPLHQGMSRTLLNRKLLYTAVTRARSLLFLVTTPTALQNAAAERERSRRTLLTTRTLGALQDAGFAPQGPLPAPNLKQGSSSSGGARRGSGYTRQASASGGGAGRAYLRSQTPPTRSFGEAMGVKPLGVGRKVSTPTRSPVPTAGVSAAAPPPPARATAPRTTTASPTVPPAQQLAVSVSPPPPPPGSSSSSSRGGSVTGGGADRDTSVPVPAKKAGTPLKAHPLSRTRKAPKSVSAPPKQEPWGSGQRQGQGQSPLGSSSYQQQQSKQRRSVGSPPRGNGTGANGVGAVFVDNGALIEPHQAEEVLKRRLSQGY